MSNCDRLSSLLEKIDNRSYGEYQKIRGEYQFAKFTLAIDRVQGDPFAAPSQVRVIIPQTVGKFPKELYQTKTRAIATRDYLVRQFAKVAQQYSTRCGSGKSGLIRTAALRQEVLERTAVLIDEEWLEVRFVVGLPARGRRILARQAVAMLCEDLPQIVDRLLYSSLERNELQHQVETIEDAVWLRRQLSERGLVAFVANGAILPRRSGVDPRPLLEAVPFQSPPELEIEFNCPNRGLIKGMGIPEGISLIVGGGYHGKSTLLRAIELGVYNHLPEDGREYVVTTPSAVKICAEDGRAVASVDLSPFINHLPQGRSTSNFITANASGSTSQAANIIEALEAGSKLLLIDEDTSATNFTIRDRRMQALIAKDREPITPFIDKVQQLYRDYGVSTILVMGGSGDYFEVADRVIAMDNYQPQDVTARAKKIARQYDTGRNAEGGKNFGEIGQRILNLNCIDPLRGKKNRIGARDLDTIILGTAEIDLSAVRQLVDEGQLKAIARGIIYLQRNYAERDWTLAELLQQINGELESHGLDILTELPQADLTLFRPQELAAALNRLRDLCLK